MGHSKSHLSQVIDAFNILAPQEPLDAKTLSELIDLTPKQTGRCLSVLHHTGYLAKVGTNNRYDCFVLKKPLKTKAITVQRSYKNRLTKQKQGNYRDLEKQITSKIIQAAMRGIERELTRRVRLTASAHATDQLGLFPSQ